MVRPKRLLLVTLATVALLVAGGDRWDGWGRDGVRGNSAPPACDVPISYRIHSIDSRFALSKREVHQAVRDAVALWESQSERTLFIEAEEGELEIELVYGPPQEAADRRDRARQDLDRAEQQFERRQARHQEKRAAFREDRADYEARLDAFRDRAEVYQRSVEAWNAGRIERTAEQRERLEAERESLEAKEQALAEERRKLEARAERLDRTADRLRRDVRDLNRHVETYNASTTELNGFKLGRYEHTAEQRAITVEKVADPEELTLILAHELGHALGIGHVAQAEAIMNRELTDANRERATLAEGDRLALREVCRNR